MFEKYNKKKYDAKILVYVLFIIGEAIVEGFVLAFIAEAVNRDFSKLLIRFLLYSLVILLISLPVGLKKYRVKRKIIN